MENRPHKQASDEEGRAESEAQLDSPADLISFARAHFSTDFPNPERQGCPGAGKLRTLAQSGALAGKQLRAHLFSCSECFDEYRRALAETKSIAPVQRRASWWDMLVMWVSRMPQPVLASGIAAVLIAVIGAYVWREYSKAPAPTVASNDVNPVGPTEESTKVGSGEISPHEQKPTPQVLVAQAKVTIDLDEYAPVRGTQETGSGDKVIKLARMNTQLALGLSEGSAKGLYSVDIVDTDGKPVLTRKARSRDGRSLIVNLDLRGLSGKRYRLRLSREGEPPEEYQILIEDN